MFRRPRLALLADDRVVALLASRALQDAFAAHPFQSATAGYEAAVAAVAPAVIVIRGVLAAGSALDAMNRLRATPRLATTPVVVLCNALDGEDAYLAAGATALASVRHRRQVAAMRG